MNKFASLALAAAFGGAATYFANSVELQATSPGTTQVGHLHISGTAITGGVQGYSGALTGIQYGGDFRSVSDQGRGVLGNASSPTGATYGGLFQAASTGGRGIAGIASATIGTTYGGFFTNFSTMGRGVYGEAKAASGVNYGVYGKCASPTGFAGYFEGNLGTSGTISGDGSLITKLNASQLIDGTVPDGRLSANVPLLNSDNTFTGNNLFSTRLSIGGNLPAIGVNEMSRVHSNPSDWGGLTVSTGNGGRPYVAFYNSANFGWLSMEADGAFSFSPGTERVRITKPGRVGIGTPTPAAQTHIVSNINNEQGALFAQNGNFDPFDVQYSGVQGTANGTNGVIAGVMGGASNTDPTSIAVGVNAFATGSGTNYGVWASATGGLTNYAGYFAGLLHASSASASVKSFLIDHPLDPANKFLEHSSVESDQRMNIYRGSVVTDANGRASIKLPNWFTALNTDIQYQLTVIDTGDSEEFVLAKVTKKYDGTSFKIRTSTPNVEVNWQVSGRRHDPTSEHIPLQVERNKVGDQKGRYLEPGAYGKDESFAIGPHSVKPADKQFSKPEKPVRSTMRRGSSR